MAETTTIQNDIPKIEKKIDNLVGKVGGSEDGSLWVKESLDPFNDCPRKMVGFPDLITGNSIVQVVRNSFAFKTSSSTAEDVHVFMDCMDTNTVIYENSHYTNVTTRPNMFVVDAANGVGTRPVGGLTIRKGIVGQDLGINSTVEAKGIPRKFLADGPCRVLSKGFEITNTTPKLTAGGSLCVYRNASQVPYDDRQACTLMNSANPTTLNSSNNLRVLGAIPMNLAECIQIPGAQQWSALEGCYQVGVMSHQTNDPQEEDYTVVSRRDSQTTAGKTWLNTFNNGPIPSMQDTAASQGAEPHMFSPFFEFGAYLSGLPPGTTLTIDYVWIIERFPTPSSELVTLANPSPYYDPIALELYSKSAQHLPHGVKKGANADGDWIKNIADVLSTFGVPGMPLVKGAVDLWNGFNPKKDPARNVGRVNSASFSPNSQPRRPRQMQQPKQIVKVLPVRYDKPLPPIPRQKRVIVVKKKRKK